MNDPRGGGGGQHQHQQLCDDGSNLISAVQSAVTHFFGQQQHEPSSSPVNEEMPEQDGSSTQSQSSSPTKQSQPQQQQCSSTSETASITILPSSSSNSSSTNFHQTDSSNNNNNNILLTSRARSMSPSLFLSNTESLYYYPDVYYNNPLLLNCNSPTNSNYYYGTYEQEEEEEKEISWSYFETSDFSSQTWLNVLSETDTIHYCGAGAAILTAVIIIHPLALIGAAATAAVGASAAWAVGLFHDLDTGYQIWNHDDFGMLFWEEEGSTANCATGVGATNVVVDPCNFVSNTAVVGGCSSSATTTTAAIATWGSQQIIQRNEEELRRAFLLEQEEKKKALLLLEQQQQQGQGVVEEEAKLGDNDETDDRNMVTLPQQQQQQQQSHVETKLQSISLQETNRLIRINSAPVKELSSSSTSSIRVKSSSRKQQQQQQQQQVLLPPRHQQQQLPNKATQHPTNPLHPPTSILSTQQSLDRHYPPLEIRVVSEVEFMDLNTIEFFQVFFSDDAPYSMKDFQQKRGDVDIVYGTWKDVVPNLSSFKPGLLPFPPNSYTRERVLTFNTLTKSYFGPAYAKATKIQRATQLSKHLLVIENMTQLSEVPFSDRFQVLERWIVEAVKSSSSSSNHDGSGSSSGGGGLYTCKLTVYAEVVMISSCRFEPQIRKKASETFTELTLGWCKLATKALEATKEQKRKRMRKHEQQQQQELLDDRNDYSVVLVGDDEASWQEDEEERSKKSRVGEVLFAKHQQKFQELDDLISHGDGIEVMHSIKAGAHSAFAQVLETPPSSLSHSSSSGLLKLRDGTVVEVARRRTNANMNNSSTTTTPFGRIPRKMNRSFLLRKLSSRVRSRQQSR